MLELNQEHYQSQASLLVNKNVTTLPVEKNININPQSSEKVEKIVEVTETNADQKDEQREALVGYIGYQSKKTQAEIYLSVALDEKVSLDNGTKEMYKSLKEVQEQNNAVKAYAAYMQTPEKEPRFSA